MLEAWLKQDAPAEKPRAIIKPSDAEEESAQVRTGDSEARKNARQRGNAVHRLMQSLPDIPLAQARSELETSINTLNTNLGVQSFPLSFPHGRSSEEISRLSKSLGYSCAVTTALGQNRCDSDLFTLCRTVIAADDDLPTFAARLSGLTYYYNRVAGLSGDAFLLFKYEEFTADPEPYLKRLERFVEIEGIDRAVMTRRINDQPRFAPDGSAIADYRPPQELSAEETGLMMAECEPFYRELGYGAAV